MEYPRKQDQQSRQDKYKFQEVPQVSHVQNKTLGNGFQLQEKSITTQFLGSDVSTKRIAQILRRMRKALPLQDWTFFSETLSAHFWRVD